MMKVNGNVYHIIDDIDTLICKLKNIRSDYYLNDKPCNIDKIEHDLSELREAFDSNDFGTMERYHNEYCTLFKRYC